MKENSPFQRLRDAMQKDETRLVVVSTVGISAMSGLMLFQLLA